MEGALYLVARIRLKPEGVETFIELGKTLFPILAEQTGWQLQSLWREGEVSEKSVTNQWLTRSENAEDALLALDKAFGALSLQDPVFSERWQMLKDTMLDEEIFFCRQYPF